MVAHWLRVSEEHLAKLNKPSSSKALKTENVANVAPCSMKNVSFNTSAPILNQSLSNSPTRPLSMPSLSGSVSLNKSDAVVDPAARGGITSNHLNHPDNPSRPF